MSGISLSYRSTAGRSGRTGGRSRISVEPVNVICFKGESGPSAGNHLLKHVRGEEVRIAVVVDVAKSAPIGGEAGMLDPVFQLILESPVTLVDIQVVSFEEIVRDIDIRPTVPIDISYLRPAPG